MIAKNYLCFSFLISLLFSAGVFSQQARLLDSFNDTKQWKVIASDLVDVSTSSEKGIAGKCLKMDYHFVGGSGYGGIQAEIPVELPENYEFSFYMKANSPNNNLEFKLLDAPGTSVWWVIYRDYSFPKDGVKIKIKQRHVTKAWGPAQESKPTKIFKVEFMISSVNGGKGTIYLDEFKLMPITEDLEHASIEPEILQPKEKSGFVSKLFDKNPLTGIQFTGQTTSVILDLHHLKEFGGLKLVWDKISYPEKYSIAFSENGSDWETVYTVDKGSGGVRYLPIPEAETRYIKFSIEEPHTEQGVLLNEIEIMGLEFSASANNIFTEITKDTPRGFYPKYFTNEASFFTVIGVNGDRKEALINEEGAVEVDKASFSIEPFLYGSEGFVTWNETKNSQSLENDYLPIPAVSRKAKNLNLTIKAFAVGEPANSSLCLAYSLKNISMKKESGKIYFAVRPFQVNPSYQFLNTQGGTSNINSIKYDGGTVCVNESKFIHPLRRPDAFGASAFDEGEVVEFLSQNSLPKKTEVNNEHHASGAFAYDFTLAPGDSADYYFIIPFHDDIKNIPSFNSDAERKKFAAKKLSSIKTFWEKKLNAVDIKLPSNYQKWVNTLRTTLAYILINRDSVGIQPGSRSYERSWIRDGALTSSALLKLGITGEVKEFIKWYASYQYENGKVPCVVDQRGADPVPENDSHGELIYLINQYYLFTKDETFLRQNYPHVKKAVEYIEYLMNQRRTEAYQNIDSLKMFYGLLPESISHEGYSEKPMHSYWDDFFAIKGLKDAVDIAAVLHQTDDEKKFTKLRDDFSKNLYSSLERTIKSHQINYIPGCAELGDFDATSTAIALYPCNEKNNLPEPFLENTFNRYFTYFTQRRDDTSFQWINYTPYEIRTVGAFIYLNQPERAHALLNYFFHDQHPQGWNHWAEVVWKNPKTAKFIGDMPHTWVGSDYISSLRSFFVYEDELNEALVLGAGLIPEWLESKEGMYCNNLQTYYGSISYSIAQEKEGEFKINISGDAAVPVGGIHFKKFPLKKSIKKITVDGIGLADNVGEDIIIRKLPAEIKVAY